jgi:hypothetical protein
MEPFVRLRRSPTVNLATGMSKARVQGSQGIKSLGSRSGVLSTSGGPFTGLASILGTAGLIAVFIDISFPGEPVPAALDLGRWEVSLFACHARGWTPQASRIGFAIRMNAIERPFMQEIWARFVPGARKEC